MSNAATVRAVETKRAEAAAMPRHAQRSRPRPRRDARHDSVEPQASRPPRPPDAPASRPAGLKDALLAELQKSKKFFYGTVIAQAQRIEVEGDRLVLAFSPQHRALKQQLEQSRPWLEEMATRLAGRKMTVVGVDGTGAAAPRPATPPAAPRSRRGRSAVGAQAEGHGRLRRPGDARRVPDGHQGSGRDIDRAIRARG